MKRDRKKLFAEILNLPFPFDAFKQHNREKAMNVKVYLL